MLYAVPYCQCCTASAVLSVVLSVVPIPKPSALHSIIPSAVPIAAPIPSAIRSAAYTVQNDTQVPPPSEHFWSLLHDQLGLLYPALVYTWPCGSIAMAWWATIDWGCFAQPG